MKKRYPVMGFLLFVILVAIFATSMSGQTPGGKLILYGDLALFAQGQPNNCFLQNRYTKGQAVGFRLTALDGTTAQPEPSAEVVVHITYGGKTVDVPARYRGVAGRGDVRPNQWTAKWVVPADAPVGVVRYSATAKDKFGRTAEFQPFNVEPSLLTIIE